MNRFKILSLPILSALLFTSALGQVKPPATTRPNLLIIHTDEHNFRTLGCYRDLLSEDQAFVWGPGVEVDTPNIDRLADEGAICTRFYAASPVCTPSRASFVSGLYPAATDSWKNDLPMNDNVVTFAEMLKQQGYATSYIGKWHLNGEGKPGFEPERQFGFDDNRFMFNRGHWKSLQMENGVPGLLGEFNEQTKALKYDVTQTDPESFTTDFLVNHALEILERDKDKPFCMMISIPDPHGPNKVRPPYDTLFDDLHFEHPRTMDVELDSLPKWGVSAKEVVTELNQDTMQDYFGMVKCIDDNIGRLLRFLDDHQLRENTIVLFTSDHGDLMGEHKRHNKGVPYETSARIPFVIRWPAKIAPGKVIRTAYTTADFTPTVLGLMDAPQIPGTHGKNDATAFLSPEKEIVTNRVVYITGSSSNWTAAIDDRYKLILSSSDIPWLFDNKRDPDELTNFYKTPEYAGIAKSMQKELLRQMTAFNDRALIKNNFLLSPDDKPETGKKKKSKQK